ncbi:4-phosphoerythronate dehydrogenase [Natronospirillum operosum]|uniref:Erythronate-4-phosphate dehydrogenase n=1 Tax=Natronospirillum operosum TaxID=2759953 RepID=A0A4Z0WB04_9GAMM|nr:4-phosphoerythronate dehydrogenase [Natronospirillum operosum]TGG94914.1 4-phosphoerythronate dehydrogenase [Natronospirillum operosum]
MRILADENMPAVARLFADVATEIRTVPGRTLTPEQLAAVDVLLVRSVTRVDAALLAQASQLRFVGTATIGTDHIDQPLLQQRQIAFASAPGCNAAGVVDYVLGALLAQYADNPAALAQARVAVVGAGNVGGRLTTRLRALGLAVMVCDPPREQACLPDQDGVSEPCFVSLQEAFTADIVCCHTPYTRAGDWPTHHMISADLLQQLPLRALFLNAGRGGVVSSAALLAATRARPDLRLVLDVWDPEPDLPLALLERAVMGTGHIAGYSAEGRVRGTLMLRQALAEKLDLPPPELKVQDLLPPVPPLRLDSDAAGAEQPVAQAWQLLQQAVLQVCDPLGDDARFRAALHAVPAARRGQAFDQYRKTYAAERDRRELASVPVERAGLSATAADLLHRAGFAVHS